MIIYQGVDSQLAQKLCSAPDVWSILTKSDNFTMLKCPLAGRLVHIDALAIGKACVDLGAGRSGKSSEIDTSVGIELLKTVGDHVEQGEDVICVYHKTALLDRDIELSLEEAFHVQAQQANDDKSKASLATKIVKIID